MKVIHIVTAISWRGGEQQVSYLLEELGNKGVRQLVICSKGSAMERHCQQLGYQYVAIKKRSSFDLYYAYRIRQEAAAFHPDLIHLHDAHAHTFAILAAVVFRNHVPLILSRRVDFPVKGNWFSRFKYNHPDIVRIICVSGEIQRITAPAIRNQDKLRTVHSGIDPDKFSLAEKRDMLRKAYQIPTTTKLIGNTAAIADHKDYFTFVDTAGILLEKGEGMKFLIIGDGPDREKIKKYVRQRNLEEHIIFTGFRKDITDILPELDVFLMTSKTEGLGTSLLDAMASGVPIVATRAGGIPEIVLDGETGLLSPVCDAEKLALNTKKVLEDESLANKLADNARVHVRHFSKTRTAEKTLEIYRQVISEMQG